MKKKKGFTIMELLATIVILSILMVIVVGTVMKLLDNMGKKYYDSQENMMVLAGKEYFTNYRSKLPKEIAKLEQVSLRTLVDEKYIDPIYDRNKNVCNMDDSYVYAQKRAEQDFQYYAYLACSNYKTTKDRTKPVITFLPSEKKAKTTIPVKMKVSDNKEGDLFYQYEAEKDKNVYIELEDKKLYDGEISISLGSEVKADEKATYQLTGYATDSSGNETVKKSGMYIIDKNEPPTIESFSIRSTTSAYNNLNTYLTLKVKDNSNGNIKICVSNTGYDKNCGWDTTVTSGYSTTSKSWNVGGSYDGGTRSIYLTVRDAKGNTARKKITYKVYKNCTEISESSSYTTSCSRSCGGGSRNLHTIKTDSNTGASCGSYDTSVSCNTFSCCSSTYTTWSSWGSCSNTCGSGQQYRYSYYYSNYDGSYCGSGSTQSQSCSDSSGCAPTKPTTPTNPTDPCKNPQVASEQRGECNCSTKKRTVTITYKNGCGTKKTTESCSCATTPSKPATKPTCKLSVSGTKGKNDWYKKGTLTVKMTTTGSPTSKGLSTSKGSTNGKTSYTVKKQGSVTVYGYVKNSAGSSNCSTSLKYDSVPPTVKIKKHTNYRGSMCPENPSAVYPLRSEVDASDSGSKLDTGSYSWPKGTSGYCTGTKHTYNGVYGGAPSIEENLCGCSGSVTYTVCDRAGNCKKS